MDENGNEIEGSISELLQIEVNGHQKWLSIRGKDAQKPILLFLSDDQGGATWSWEIVQLYEAK